MMAVSHNHGGKVVGVLGVVLVPQTTMMMMMKPRQMKQMLARRDKIPLALMAILRFHSTLTLVHRQ